MIHLKNKKFGFTLIEVLLSTAIVGIVLMPIYALQGRVMERISKSVKRAQRMFIAFDFLLDAQSKVKEDENEIKKGSDNPSMQMIFKREAIPNKSSLNKLFNNLQLTKVSCEWQVEGKKQSSELISIVFTPPKPKPEKEEETTGQGEEASKSPSKAQPAQTGAKQAPAGAKK